MSSLYEFVFVVNFSSIHLVSFLTNRRLLANWKPNVISIFRIKIEHLKFVADIVIVVEWKKNIVYKA